MALNVTATTVDTYINTALTYLLADDFLNARKYIAMAQVAKKALPQNEIIDGQTTEWDNEIRDALAAVDALEAAYNRSVDQRRLLRVRVTPGRRCG